MDVGDCFTEGRRNLGEVELRGEGRGMAVGDCCTEGKKTEGVVVLRRVGDELRRVGRDVLSKSGRGGRDELSEGTDLKVYRK
jgi:hypothetical protein